MFKGSHVPLVAFLGLVLFFPATGISSVSAQPHMIEVIVGFAHPERAAQAVQNAGGDVVLTYSIIPAFLATVPENAVTALDRNPNIRYVHENGVVEAVAQTVPWGIERVNAPTVWSDTTGTAVSIAILDTGVGPHRDLQVAGGTNTIGGSSFSDDNGHGTHVAGSVAALNNNIDVVGVAFDANIYSVKVLDGNGSGTVNSVVLGIEWSVNNNMDIISMSLGTKSHFEALKEAVDSSYAAGLLNVAAAGNEGNPAGKGDNIIYPARYDSVIAVGAIREDNVRASFSSTGPALELMAPGQKILSTYLNDSLKELSGTSMAAPHVSGVAALVWSLNPELANSEVRQILQDTSTPLGDHNRYGHGLVNAQEAAKAVQEDVAEPEPTPITVSIVSPSDGDVVQNSVTIQAQVNADAPVDSVEYAINNDTFSTMSFNDVTGYWEAVWDTSSVSDGEHIITVRAADVDGNTDSRSVTVTVTNSVQQLSVVVTTDKETYQMGDWVNIHVQVTDGTSAVSGASVSVQIVTASGRTYSGDGTSDVNGEVAFKLKTKNPDGKGTYTVNATASKAGYDSGTDSTTFVVN